MFELLISLLFAVLPPCATDDGTGFCAWDAEARGNGVGTSFVVLGEGNVFEVTR